MIICNPNNTKICGPEAVCYRKNKGDTLYFCMCPQDSEPLTEAYSLCSLKKSKQPVNSKFTIMVSKSATTEHTTTSVNQSVNATIEKSTVFKSLSDNIFVCALAASFILLFAVILCLRRFLCHKSISKKYKANKNKALAIPLRQNIILEERYTTNPQYTSTGVHSDNLPIVPIIQRSAITDLQLIGEGFFGKVFKGQFHSFDNDVEKVETVAVKMLKQTNLKAQEDFMWEVEIMSSFNHPNILSFIGLCPSEILNPSWMVFEYMPFGDLASVLRNNGHNFWTSIPSLPKLTSESLLFIALQISDGMVYLAKQRFVHRDLACRNCLVGSDLIVKIADFGMSRDVYTCDYYKIGGTKMLPVRWMAPESIVYGRFTLESDIWSYGVVLWEIYSYGKQPYYGRSNEEAFKCILEGILLDIPEQCPEEVADIMKACWKKDTKERITFSDISNRLLLLKESTFQQNSFCLPRPPPMPVTIYHPGLLKGSEEKNEEILEEDDYSPQKSVSPSLSSMEYLEVFSLI
ncbi:hypothetical protein PGB90_008190 [Kerria lacca]